MQSTTHLSGLRDKMAARDKRHRAKGNKSATGLLFKAPASPPPVWPGNRKARPGKVGEPFSRNPAPTGPTERKPTLNRWTGKPHENRREIARCPGQTASGLKRGSKA